jgi:ABC-2 type transport system permease protein
VPAVKLKEMFQAVAANARTFKTISYATRGRAARPARRPDQRGPEHPPLFSRKVLAGANPAHRLIEDNTDQFVPPRPGGRRLSRCSGPTTGKSPPGPRLSRRRPLSVVEVYPYVPYIQYLLPGTIVLAIFVSAMIGGGIIFIDDKARGLHEGYLVTPITKFELILGFNLAGVAKAVLSGLVLVTLGSIIAGIPDPLNLLRLARMLVLVVCTALALISMMFLIMVRVSDPLVPRAIFGVLNTVLFFPSGAVYPIKAFPDLDAGHQRGRSVHLRRSTVSNPSS